MRSLREAANESNPNKVPDVLREVKAGEALSLVPRSLRIAVASNTGVLPEDVKAAHILSCNRSAGTVTGPATPVLTSATVATNQVKVDQLGNLAFFADDAVTEAEVLYIPAEGEIIEEDLTVASNAGPLHFGRKARVLLEAYNTTSGESALTVLLRGASTPSAGEARINVAGGSILFANGVTKARVRYIAWPASSVGTRLDGDTAL
jgi:hypothetical protein